LFGFCITHSLNTGCAKIWKKKSVAKRLNCVDLSFVRWYLDTVVNVLLVLRTPHEVPVLPRLVCLTVMSLAGTCLVVGMVHLYTIDKLKKKDKSPAFLFTCRDLVAAGTNVYQVNQSWEQHDNYALGSLFTIIVSGLRGLWMWCVTHWYILLSFDFFFRLKIF
jgi:hypothetical protein